MAERPIRVYADTSVFGGVFDEEFAAASGLFFDQVRSGRFLLVVSALVRAEIAPAPEKVRSLFEELLPDSLIVEPDERAIQLRQAYLKAGIVPGRYAEDALHVALATANACPVIVSWNFRHIVHFRKVPLYNAVNAMHGYPPLAICAPPEIVVYDEDQDV